VRMAFSLLQSTRSFPRAPGTDRLRLREPFVFQRPLYGH
jgi:hypothetical protein